MVRKLITFACAMLMTSVAWAEAETREAEAQDEAAAAFTDDLEADLNRELDSSTSTRDAYACNQYNQYGSQYAYSYCTRDNRCRWTGYRCESAWQNPYPQPTRCENIRDWNQCQRSGCYWDNYYGCRTYPSQPVRCEQIRDWNQCQRSGCYWDNYYGCSSRPGGGSGYELYECTARDAGWEEHLGGHRAQGRTQWEAQQNAINICQQAHGRCVIQSCRRVR